MKTQIRQLILDNNDKYNLDKDLVDQYYHRDQYNFIKRKIIEHKFDKAVEKAIEEDYKRASIKVD